MSPFGAPLLLRIKRNCLDDGPGIRTTVFFKGCPLSCAWCHNPESRRARAELSHDIDACIACERCVEACDRGAISEAPISINREICDLCFECVAECPSHAFSRQGEPADMDAILAIIRRDMPFFRTSGGGVTLSGGEPTLYMDFSGALLRACREMGVHTLVETCGLFELDRFRELMLPWIDSVYFDIKLMDAEKHREYCGVSNETILKNLKWLLSNAEEGQTPKVLPRVPLVPGVTATDENLAAIAEFLRGEGARQVALLPYNPTWLKKPAMIGEEPRLRHAEWMRPEDMERCGTHFKDFEIAEG